MPSMTRRLLLAAALLGLAAPWMPALGAELVMVERAGCVWCERWNRDVAPVYGKSDEGQRAPLRRVDLADGQPGLDLKEPVRFTPTFVLVEQGREVGRITGYLDDAMFWGLLGAMLARLEEKPAR